MRSFLQLLTLLVWVRNNSTDWVQNGWYETTVGTRWPVTVYTSLTNCPLSNSLVKGLVTNKHEGPGFNFSPVIASVTGCFLGAQWEFRRWSRQEQQISSIFSRSRPLMASAFFSFRSSDDQPLKENSKSLATQLTCTLFTRFLLYFHYRISPNVRYAIYTIGLRVANDSVWTKVFYRYQTETVPSEKKKLMYALTTSQNEVILKR